MRRITLQDRLRYEFDNTMSRGPVALIGWLAVVAFLLIALISLIVQITGIDPEGRGFLGLMWAGLMRTLDAGTMGGDTGNWPFLFAMLLVTLGGIFVVSTLIGVLTTGIEEQLDELRKGRSFVAEENHTVILGWSPQVFTVISELVIANENQPRAVIAVLAEHDKVDMEDEIRTHIADTKTTRIVCRTGSPIDLADLEVVNPHAARSIIILAPETDDPDPEVIKTILAITNNPHRHPEPYHIVAVIREAKNLEVARMVAQGEAQLVLANEVIARVAAQTCRQSGLSVAYTELLDFGGDEIYFKEEPSLVGLTFGESLFAYDDSTVIGLAFANGAVALKPPMDTVLQEGDQVIAISEDDDTIRLSGYTEFGIDPTAISDRIPQPAASERTLILGWNDRAMMIIRELDAYVSKGSEVVVMAQDFDNVNTDEAALALIDYRFTNTKAEFVPGDTTDRATLDDLNPASFDHIIVLSYEGALDPQQADARTLITLLHLRDISEKTGQDMSIVSEMLDVRNRELAEVTHADDYIISNKLLSLMLSQISENKQLTAIFQDFFDPEGAEMYLKPAQDYVQLGIPINFYTVLEAARQKDAVAVGYRLAAQAYDAGAAYGVKVNPRKSEQVTFGSGDKIIVIADE